MNAELVDIVKVSNCQSVKGDLVLGVIPNRVDEPRICPCGSQASWVLASCSLADNGGFTVAVEWVRQHHLPGVLAVIASGHTQLMSWLPRWVRVALILSSVVLASCGGGGAGVDEGVRYAQTDVQGTSVTGHPVTVNFGVDISVAGDGAFYLFLDESANLVVAGDSTLQDSGPGWARVHVALVVSSGLAPGNYTSELSIRACYDEACTRGVGNGPLKIPFKLTVLPQISVERAVDVTRVGREAGLRQSLAVSVAPEAGTLVLQPQDSSGGAYIASLEGNRLVIQPNKVRAGVYPVNLVIFSPSKPEFRAEVAFIYTVLPPPEGERDISIEPSNLEVALVEGSVSTHRVKVTPATWTDEIPAPEISTQQAVKAVTHLGGDIFELTVDARDLVIVPTLGGSRTAFWDVLTFTQSGYHSSARTLTVTSTLTPNATIAPPAVMLLNAHTLLPNLGQSLAINVATGDPTTWTATVDQPWVRLTRSSGTTGVDNVEFVIDPAFMPRLVGQQIARFTATLGRAGAPPVQQILAVTNALPQFDMAAPGVLTSGRRRVVLHGAIAAESGLLQPGVLKVTGANLLDVRRLVDYHYGKEVAVLALDLDGFVAGTAVTIETQGGAFTTRIDIPVVGEINPPFGLASLPYGNYRPASFVLSQNAMVFAGNGNVYRWPYTSSAWGSLQSAALSGLVDVAAAPDEKRLYASTAETLWALDPGTLDVLGRSAVKSPNPFPTLETFDAAAPQTGHALVFTEDGRALASAVYGESRQRAGIAELDSCDLAFGVSSDLLRQPCLDHVHYWLFGLEPPNAPVRGTVLTRNTRGTVSVATMGNGETLMLRDWGRPHGQGPILPAGTSITAVDAYGNWVATDEGNLLLYDLRGTVALDVRRQLPSGLHIGGMGFLGDAGQQLLVYTYELTGLAGEQRASNAKLFVMDMRPGPTDGGALTGNLTIVAQINLAQALGCTESLAPAESCKHLAHITVVPGNAAAILLGPRAIMSVPLPAILPRASTRERPNGRAIKKPVLVVPRRF